MKQLQNSVFQLEGKITASQREFFKKHGFIQFKNFLPRETVQEFIREIEQVQSHLVQNNVSKINGVPLKFGTDTNGKPFIQRLAFTSQYSKKLSLFLQDPRLQLLLEFLGNYEGRIGENEKDGLVVNHYVNTPSSKFTKMGWHTDSPRDLFLGTRILPMLNVGLHLDDCDAGNGGLRVLPGTHTQSLFRLLFRKKYFVDNKPDKKEAGFNIEAGDLTIHDGRLWHRVQQSPNVGEKSRRRVMYIPMITGAYQLKHSDSPTPFYHRLAQINWNPYPGKLSLAGFAKRWSIARQ